MRCFVSSRGMIPAFIGLILVHLCSALLAQESVRPTTNMQRAHELMMDNMSYFLDGAVDVDILAGEVNWNMSSRQVLTQMERTVRDIHGLQSLDYLTSFRNFSSEVEELIERVDALSHRDLRRWRMASGLSESQEWYVMVQSALDELKMQIAMELNVHYNAQLKEALDEAIRLQNEVGLEVFEASDWDPQSLLPPLDWTASEITQSELSSVDQSEWVGPRADNQSGLEDWLQRILNVLESQDQRLRRLEGEVVDPQGLRGQLLSLSTDPSLAHLHMPETLDVGFSVGSSMLGLNAKMQLHEIMELMGRYPQIRVVCTGHADAAGERNQNLVLSKRRAQRVQAYLLESGVGSERVLLNYFGEERERRAGSQDRRVEVAFYLR